MRHKALKLLICILTLLLVQIPVHAKPAANVIYEDDTYYVLMRLSVNKTLSDIPADIKTRFFDDYDGKIIISDDVMHSYARYFDNAEDIEEIRTEGTVLLGCHEIIYSSKDAYIFAMVYESDLGNYNKLFQSTIFHEMGHFLDFTTDASIARKWAKLQAKYPDILGYEEENTEEFFAEAYAIYKTEPQRMNREAPEMYGYIQDLEENYSQKVCH